MVIFGSFCFRKEKELIMLHENWKDYTKEEINEIVNTKCKYCKYKCGSLQAITNIFCDYLSITGKRRETRPEDCQHYLEK